jgi:putative ABC transport system permease protein
LTGIVTIIAIEITSGNPVTLASQFIFFALAVSFAVGLFFGIYPAMRAAAMDPVDALRVE